VKDQFVRPSALEDFETYIVQVDPRFRYLMPTGVKYWHITLPLSHYCCPGYLELLHSVHNWREYHPTLAKLLTHDAKPSKLQEPAVPVVHDCTVPPCPQVSNVQYLDVIQSTEVPLLPADGVSIDAPQGGAEVEVHEASVVIGGTTAVGNWVDTHVAACSGAEVAEHEASVDVAGMSREEDLSGTSVALPPRNLEVCTVLEPKLPVERTVSVERLSVSESSDPDRPKPKMRKFRRYGRVQHTPNRLCTEQMDMYMHFLRQAGHTIFMVEAQLFKDLYMESLRPNRRATDVQHSVTVVRLNKLARCIKRMLVPEAGRIVMVHTGVAHYCGFLFDEGLRTYTWLSSMCSDGQTRQTELEKCKRLLRTYFAWETDHYTCVDAKCVHQTSPNDCGWYINAFLYMRVHGWPCDTVTKLDWCDHIESVLAQGNLCKTHKCLPPPCDWRSCPSCCKYFQQ